MIQFVIMKKMSLLVLPLLCSSSLFGSQAMANLADAASAWASFDDYTNNTLRVASVDSSEWDPVRRLDRLPFDMPFQLVVGSAPADRAAAEAALTTVVTSMPRNIRAYFIRHRLMAPLQQWLVRRCKPGITNEALYVSAAAHPNVWRAADFDLARLAAAAQSLTSNCVPIMANIYSYYDEYKPSPITRAQPLVDYPDPRTESTYETPFGTAVVLRAPEGKRKFRFLALGWPFRDGKVNFKWMVKPQWGVSVRAIQERWQQCSPERGYGELTLDWGGAVRRDVFVFARYGEGAWGPPSVISFYRIPNERRQYDNGGRIQSIEYLPAQDVIPQLYQNKQWKDVYGKDSLGQVFCFLRTRAGQANEDRFSLDGERVLETYAGDLPKVTAKVRYFTDPEDPLTLDYEVTDKKADHPNKPFVPRTRGEFPEAMKRK